MRKNEELLNEIKRRDEESKKLELVEKENLKKIEKDKYVITSWTKYKNNQNQNLLYLSFVFFVTILPIVIGFILKENKTLNTWMESLGNNQLYIWLVLVLIFVIELFGRSYIFNKEKVKNGWLWLGKLILKNKKHKEEKKIEFSNEFENNYLQ